jgi:integrase
MKKYKFKQYCKTIGPYPTVTREMAIDQCNLFVANLVKFGDLVPPKPQQAASCTVKEAFDLYLSKYSYCKKYWKYIQTFSDREISGLSREEIQNLHQQIKSPVMANRTIRIFCAAINNAIRENLYIGINPAEKIHMNRETPRQRYLMPSEAPAVIKYLYQMRNKGNTQRNAADALLLMLFTWQRKSNVMSMRWNEIDETGTWTIPADKAKARKDIVIPLSAEAIEIIDQRKDNGSEYVFPNPRNPAGHIADIKNSWKRVQRDCGLQDFHIHDLRHTGATYALRSGADITTVSAGLAHASVSFTAKVYAHVMLESKKEAARGAIDAMMGKRKKK